MADTRGPLTEQELHDLRDQLVRARASGVLTLEYEGKRLTYRDDAGMAAAIADLETRIRNLDVTPGTRPGVVRFTSSKGF